MNMSRPRVVKRRGRPSVDDSGAVPADVHLTLPASEYDDVYQLAVRNRESVQAIIRRGLKRLLEDERGATL